MSIALHLTHNQAEPSSKAAQKALSITEILEQVLLYLPVKTISSSKQVCCSWKNTIEGSLHLQKKLFLRSCDYYDFKCDGFYHPALIEVYWNPSSRTWPTLSPAVVLNPLMVPYSHALQKLTRAPPGPWQNTLMSQPAMTELKVTIGLEDSYIVWNPRTLHRLIKNPHGITIRDVATWVTKFMDDQGPGPVYSISVSYRRITMC